MVAIKKAKKECLVDWLLILKTKKKILYKSIIEHDFVIREKERVATNSFQNFDIQNCEQMWLTMVLAIKG